MTHFYFWDFPFTIFGPWLTLVTETAESKTVDKRGPLHSNCNIKEKYSEGIYNETVYISVCKCSSQTILENTTKYLQVESVTITVAKQLHLFPKG